MEDPEILFGKFRWERDDYDQGDSCYSRLFNLGGCNWKILIEKCNLDDYILLYLVVPDYGLPTRWCRDTTFRLTLVNQNFPDCSMTQGGRFIFNEKHTECGYPFKDIGKNGNGFVVSGSMIVEAEVFVHSSIPRAAKCSKFNSYLTNLEEFIHAAEASADNEAVIPEEIKEAKKNLKECLEGLFKLSKVGKLSAALSTLSSAKTGLLPSQQRAIQTYWDNFDDFISDFIALELHKSRYELERCQQVKMLNEMKEKREMLIEQKQLLDGVGVEEEELMKKLREVKARKRKMNSEWNALVTDSEKAKEKYSDQEGKVEEAEVKKRRAQDMVSNGNVAWVNLQQEFLYS